MKPNKAGQIVKFQTPLNEEEKSQQYVITEIYLDVEKPRAHIQALNTGFSIPVIETVYVDELEVVAVNTADLLGYPVTIKTSNNQEISGVVLKAKEENIFLEMDLTDNIVDTNVELTIEDSEGDQHSGYLVVKN